MGQGYDLHTCFNTYKHFLRTYPKFWAFIKYNKSSWRICFQTDKNLACWDKGPIRSSILFHKLRIYLLHLILLASATKGDVLAVKLGNQLREG